MSLADLPEAHRRSVASTLRLMEERLLEVRQWLEGGARATATLRIEEDVDPACRVELRQRLDEALARIGDYYQTLDLPPEPRSLYRNCNATLGLTWELAPDLRPHRMHGYGRVPEALAPELAALAEDLEARVTGIQQALVTRKGAAGGDA